MIEDFYEMEVPFFDVDSMHIVWHGHYCKYFELARCKLLDKIGYNYRDMTESGYSFPIIDMRVKYVESIRFGQKIRIKATLVEWEIRIKIDYQIVDSETNKKLTSGHTIQAAVGSRDGQLKLQSPKVFFEKVEKLFRQ